MQGQELLVLVAEVGSQWRTAPYTEQTSDDHLPSQSIQSRNRLRHSARKGRMAPALGCLTTAPRLHIRCRKRAPSPHHRFSIADQPRFMLKKGFLHLQERVHNSMQKALVSLENQLLQQQNFFFPVRGQHSLLARDVESHFLFQTHQYQVRGCSLSRSRAEFGVLHLSEKWVSFRIF
jgi:hypothetical protein